MLGYLAQRICYFSFVLVRNVLIVVAVLEKLDEAGTCRAAVSVQGSQKCAIRPLHLSG